VSGEQTSVEFKAGDAVRLDPSEWEARAAAMYRAIEDDEDTPVEAVSEALRGFRLADEQGRNWVFDGTNWVVWDGQQWKPARPAGPLRLLPFSLTLVPSVDDRPPLGLAPLDETVDDVLPLDTTTPPDDDAPQRGSGVPAEQAYRASHTVPPSGLHVWSRPDPSMSPVAELDPGLDVMLVEELENGWARVVCSNRWSGWVDGRRLIKS
jgi:hypothetical protein